MQMYPGWSARDNYAMSKKKKRKRLMQHQQRDVVDGGGGGALQMKVAGANLASPRLSGGRVMDAPIKCDGKCGCALHYCRRPCLLQCDLYFKDRSTSIT